MTAGTYNFCIDQNADNVLTVTWTDQNGTVINLTGYSAELMVKQSPLNATPLVTLSTSSGGITLGGAAGTIIIDFSVLLTMSIPPSVTCYYDLRMTNGNTGLNTRLLQGQITNSIATTR